MNNQPNLAPTTENLHESIYKSEDELGSEAISIQQLNSNNKKLNFPNSDQNPPENNEKIVLNKLLKKMESTLDAELFGNEELRRKLK